MWCFIVSPDGVLQGVVEVCFEEEEGVFDDGE